jgi:hypothetical protein
LLQPKGKDLWENSAKCITKIDLQRIYPYFTEILTWLQDLTWPGALIIYTYVLKIQNEQIKNKIIESIIKSNEDNDETWFYNLVRLSIEKDILFEYKIKPEIKDKIQSLIANDEFLFKLKLQNIINKWDPMSLISNGAPIDEYETEIDMIFQLIKKEKSNISEIINSTFKKHFGISNNFIIDKLYYDEIISYIRHCT